jgi:hypothetical protein
VPKPTSGWPQDWFPGSISVYQPKWLSPETSEQTSKPAKNLHQLRSGTLNPSRAGQHRGNLVLLYGTVLLVPSRLAIPTQGVIGATTKRHKNRNLHREIPGSKNRETTSAGKTSNYTFLVVNPLLCPRLPPGDRFSIVLGQDVPTEMQMEKTRAFASAKFRVLSG